MVLTSSFPLSLSRRVAGNPEAGYEAVVIPKQCARGSDRAHTGNNYHGNARFKYENNEMTIASDLLRQHVQTLVDDNARWQTLIADDILWELAYAPSLGHPAQLAGRKEAVHHATWFVGAVQNFRFFDLKIYPLADPQGAVAEVKGEGIIKSTGRMYRQDYMVFLRVADGKIAFLREYFDPVRAAKALYTPVLGLESR